MKFACACALVSLVFVGCKSPDPVPISPNVFLISGSDAGGPWADPSSLKAKVIKRANEFAASRGKVAIAVSTNERPGGFGRIGNCEYQFRLVDPNSPEAQAGTTLGPQPSIQIVRSETKIDADLKLKQPDEKRTDIYLELEKLDSLRKKGILTEAEFEAEKKKILNQHK